MRLDQKKPTQKSSSSPFPHAFNPVLKPPRSCHPSGLSPGVSLGCLSRTEGKAGLKDAGDWWLWAGTGGGMQVGSKEECLAWAAGGAASGSDAGWRSHGVDTSVSEVKGQTKMAWQSAVRQACRH